jgi:hypothetical protein
MVELMLLKKKCPIFLKKFKNLKNQYMTFEFATWQNMRC